MKSIQDILSILSDPQIFEQNRLPAHADSRFIGEDGKYLDPVSLNGQWEFACFTSPAELDISLISKGALPDKISVPGHIQMQGFDYMQYVNTQYPWDGVEKLTAPEIPAERNACGLYVKNLDLPDGFKGRAVRLALDGVESSCFVFLNGQYVGYTEDSFTRHEFDITAYLGGENRLVLLVTRWCSGSWLEDQDFWRFSGVFRDVSIYCPTPVYIEDVELKAEPDKDFSTGRLSARLSLSSNKECSVRLELKLNGESTECIAKLPVGACEKTLEISINSPKLWSAEEPNLYDAEIRVFDERDTFICGIKEPVGFRRFEMKDGIMLLNGRRLVFKGVNRHEFSCDKGRAISAADIERDLIALKRSNVNAIRTSHYPNNSAFYRLCDKYGFYVMDETNLESHGTWMIMGMIKDDTNSIVPNDDKRWLPAVLDRGRSMLERDKNHPCILVWSCGNESYGGSVLYELSEWFRQRDCSRLVHYEGVFVDRRYNATSDMESRMYERVEQIEEYLRSKPEKPFVLCEYCHAMGSSVGNMDEYVELSRKYPQYQGGFVWDFADQGLRSSDGKSFLCGGDFGDRPTDGIFCCNGIFDCEHKETAKSREVKAQYQPLVIKPSKSGIFIRNERLFTNTDDLLFCWTLRCDGREMKTGKLEVSLAPGECVTLPLPCTFDGCDGELILSCSAKLKTRTLYADAGFELAYGEGILRPFEHGKNTAKPAKLILGDCNIGVKMNSAAAMISRSTGLLYSLKSAGVELLKKPLEADFWRAPTDNENGFKSKLFWGHWKLASLYADCWRLSVDEENATISSEFQVCCTETPVSFAIVLKFYENDSFDVSLHLDSTPGTVPCAGLSMTLPAELCELEWYGNLEPDSYPDRLGSAKIGLGRGKASRQLPNYVRVQDCANKTLLRSFTVKDEKGTGLRISSDILFSARALPYTAHELEIAEKPCDLPPVTKTALSIFGGMSGCGGDDSWGAPIHEQYQLKTEQGLDYTFSVEIL